MLVDTCKNPVSTCFDDNDQDSGSCVKCEEGLISTYTGFLVLSHCSLVLIHVYITVVKKIVELLLSKCPELMFHRTNTGLTPLMFAVINDAYGVVNGLFTKNVDVEV